MAAAPSLVHPCDRSRGERKKETYFMPRSTWELNRTFKLNDDVMQTVHPVTMTTCTIAAKSASICLAHDRRIVYAVVGLLVPLHNSAKILLTARIIMPRLTACISTPIKIIALYTSFCKGLGN